MTLSTATDDRERLLAQEASRAAGHFRRMLPAQAPRLRSVQIVTDLHMAGEAAAVFLAGLGAAAYHVGYNLEAEGYLGQYLPALFLAAAAFILIARGRGLYEFQTLCSFPARMGALLACLAAAFTAIVVAGFALGVANDYSRVWLALWFACAAASVLAGRAFSAKILLAAAKRGLIARKAAVFGSPSAVSDIVQGLQRSSPEVHVSATFSPRQPSGDGSAADLDVLAELVQFGQTQDVDLVIVARDLLPRKNLADTLSALSVLPAEVQLYLDLGDSAIPVRGVSNINGMHFLDLQRRPLSGWNRLIKLAEDYTVAVASLVLLSPVLIVIAVAVKLDSPGPVFFRQRRHGFNHRIINIWKFRTMHVMEDGDNFRQAVEGDGRVTRSGRFLRGTSLDELPQLFNVLAGEMSVVGPRPHPLALNSRYAALLQSYGSRHRVKPGITGWAQINGFRGPTADTFLMERRVELDLEYIENWSIWMDLKILALTPFRGLAHKNAI